jgi:segregation and condensation protein A
MAIPVKLEIFEGPLDLLLHLIEKNKVDIYDIPIALITDQYLDYVNQMGHEDLNVVSEFLVMAATLIDIKSRMLLPKEVDEEGNDIDPRDELVAQLIEYRMFKQIAAELKNQQLYAGKAMYKAPDIPPEVAKYEPPVDLDKLLAGVSIERMQQVFAEVLKRQENKIDKVRAGFGKIEKEEVSLPDKLTYIRKYAKREKHFSFKQLLERQQSKVEVIVTFLAVLELMKTGKISVVQEHIFDDIVIESRETA